MLNKPTRISQGSETIVDHIWTNSYSPSINSGIILHPISDHMPVIMSINTNKSNKTVTVYKRSFNDKNINKFNQELEKMDISPIINENKANVSFKIFVKKYLKIFDQAFPVTQFKQAQTKNKWFNEELKNLL